MRSSLAAGWNESFPDTPSYRELSPPRPVTVDLGQAIAQDHLSLRTVNPLWVTAGGLSLTGYCPGHLHAWVRLTTGSWLGLCTFTAHSGNRRSRLALAQWVPASSITAHPQHE